MDQNLESEYAALLSEEYEVIKVGTPLIFHAPGAA